jgi:hypothetical protein
VNRIIQQAPPALGRRGKGHAEGRCRKDVIGPVERARCTSAFPRAEAREDAGAKRPQLHLPFGMDNSAGTLVYFGLFSCWPTYITFMLMKLLLVVWSVFVKQKLADSDRLCSATGCSETFDP